MTDKYGIEGHKLMYHPRRVTEVISGKDDWEISKDIYPIYIEVSPIGACNHRCSFCAVDYIGYNPVRLDLATMRDRLFEMAELGLKSIMYAGEGEPLLHKQISAMIEITKQSGIDASLTTNATVLPNDFLDRALPNISWVKASINAGTSLGYSKIHNTKESDFYKAIDNLKQMVAYREEYKIDVTLGAQSLLLPENLNEMSNLIKICRDEISLDYLVIKPYSQHMFSKTHVYEDISYEEYADIKDELARMSTSSFNVVFRDKTMMKHAKGNGERYEKCHATPNLWAYIMADGRVFSCSAFLLDERFELGNINNNTFKEIWEGKKRKRNFKFVNNGLDISECRVNCRMDEVNRYLESVISRDINHINFI